MMKLERVLERVGDGSSEPEVVERFNIVVDRKSMKRLHTILRSAAGVGFRDRYPDFDDLYFELGRVLDEGENGR